MDNISRGSLPHQTTILNRGLNLQINQILGFFNGLLLPCDGDSLFPLVIGVVDHDRSPRLSLDGPDGASTAANQQSNSLARDISVIDDDALSPESLEVRS